MDIITTITSENSDKKDDWTFPIILKGKQSPYRIVLVDIVAGGSQGKNYYQGVVLSEGMVNTNWWMELDSVEWIKENYEPYYGEIVLQQKQNT